jgi:FtsH-binding integral membrane protein
MMRSIPTELAGIPVWLMLFVAAGFFLFFFKIAGNPSEREELSKLRLFFLIATILLAIAGIANFVIWASPVS